MDAKTLEALKASIAKWERNAAVEHIRDAQVHSMACPLCALFVSYDGCEGCPVSARTRQAGCEGSPWVEAYLAKGKGNLEAFKIFAREEVTFLKSLLPEES